MDTIILNGQAMITVEISHHYLQQKLGFPDYYGSNLDALWDLLTTISQPLIIKLVETQTMRNNLGEYGEALLTVFKEAAKENELFIFEYS